MKKLVTMSMILLMALFLGAVAAGCRDRTTKELTVDPGSVETHYLIGETPYFDGITAEALVGGTKVQLAFKDLEITGFSSAVAGNFELTVKYGDKTEKIPYTVYEINADTVEVQTFGLPDNIEAYRNHIASTDAKSGYAVRNDGYYAGTDNDYILKPKVRALKLVGTPKIIDYDGVVPNISVKVTGTEAALTGVALTNVVAIDAAAAAFRFKAAAVGRSYDLTLSISDDMADEALAEPYFTHTVKVIEGYNVYTAKQLSAADNSDKNRAAWNAVKSEICVPEITDDNKFATRAVIIHNDLTVTNDDLPAGFFEEAPDHRIGLKNGNYEIRTSIFAHETDGDSFSVIGNYFGINASGVPLVLRQGPTNDYNTGTDGDTFVTSYADLFNFGSITKLKAGNVGEAVVKNISLQGNGQRKGGTAGEGENPVIYSGGLRMIESSIKTLEVDNVVSNAWLIAYSLDDEAALDTLNKISNTKNFDSFSMLIYMWCASRVYLDGNVFEGTGGPVIVAEGREMYMQAQVDAPNAANFDNDGKRWHTSEIYVDSEASLDKISTTVSAHSAWFEMSNASAIVGGISQISIAIPATCDRQNPKLPLRSFVDYETHGEDTISPKILFLFGMSNADTTLGTVYIGKFDDVNPPVKIMDMAAAAAGDGLDATQKYIWGQGSPLFQTIDQINAVYYPDYPASGDHALMFAGGLPTAIDADFFAAKQKSVNLYSKAAGAYFIGAMFDYLTVDRLPA
ncbi:MAG: hypothetical protein LBS99_03225 [Clostridiales bacterium]|nr:hypothetical protein [Clostridiales bacterium]